MALKEGNVAVAIVIGSSWLVSLIKNTYIPHAVISSDKSLAPVALKMNQLE